MLVKGHSLSFQGKPVLYGQIFQFFFTFSPLVKMAPEAGGSLHTWGWERNLGLSLCCGLRPRWAPWCVEDMISILGVPDWELVGSPLTRPQPDIRETLSASTSYT